MKEKQPSIGKSGLKEKKIFAAMSKLQKYPQVREIFKESAMLFRTKKIKNIRDISKNKKIRTLVKDLNSNEKKMYKKHLKSLGFPSLSDFGLVIKNTRVTLGRRSEKIEKATHKILERAQFFSESESPILKTLNQHIKFLGNESFFQKAHKAAKIQSIVERSEKSIEFYQEYAIEYGMNFDFRDMLREGGIKRSNFLLGRMYFYKYIPEKPSSNFDKYPLIFILSKTDEYFEGINFHQMMPKHRVELLENMFNYLNKQDYTKNTRILFNSFNKIIKGNRKFRYAKFSYRRYRFDSIHSKMIEVHPLDWEIAMSVPTEKFYSINNRRLPNNVVWKQTDIRVKRNK